VETPLKKWLILGGAISAEVAATLSLKAALNQPAWYFVVIVGYLAAFVLLAVCLRLGMTIGVVYGIWGAGGVITTALLSAVLFSEPLTLLMAGGMILIIAGVLTVELGAENAGTAR
jgi:small multidrug resistance pump